MSPLLLSLELSAVVTVILLVIGAPIAYGLAYGRFRGRALVEALVALPLVLPPTVLGYYLLVAFGHRGWLGAAWEAVFHTRLAFSFTGLVIASVCYSLPFAVQPMQAAFQGLDRHLLEAAWTLGVSRAGTFRRLVLPACLPGVVSAAVLSFAHTLGEFGVVLMVGGNIPGATRTVSIAIYDMVEGLLYAEAGRLSLLLLVLSYGLLLLFSLNRRLLAPWLHP